MCKQDFEKGKQLLVEAIEILIGLYARPYVKIMEALQMLGLRGAMGAWRPEDPSLMKLGYDTFLAGLKSAGSAEEIERVIEENRRFFNMTFEHRDKEDA